MDATRESAPYPEDIVQEIIRWQNFDDSAQLISKCTFFKCQSVLFEDKSETAILRQTEHMHFWRHDKSASSRVRFLEMEPGLLKSLCSPHSDLMHKLYYLWLSCEHHHNTTISIPSLQEKLKVEKISAEFLTLLSFVSPKSLASLIEALLLQEAKEVWKILADLSPKYFGKYRQKIGTLIISELIAILTVNPGAAPQGDYLADLLEQYWPYVNKDTFLTLETLQKFLAELSKKSECIYSENDRLRDILRMIFTDLQQKLSQTAWTNLFKDFPFTLPQVLRESPSQTIEPDKSAPETDYKDHTECAINWWQSFMHASEHEIYNTEWLAANKTVKRYLPYLNKISQAAIFQKIFRCWETAREESDKAILYPLIRQYCERFDESLQEQFYQTLHAMLQEHADFAENTHNSRIAKANEARDIVYLCCDILDKKCLITDKISTLLSQYFPFLAKHYRNLAQEVLQSLESKIPKALYQNHVLSFLPDLLFKSEYDTYNGLRFLKHLAVQDSPLLQDAIETYLCTLPPEKRTVTILLEIACVKKLSDNSMQFLTDHIASQDPYLQLAFKVIVACRQNIPTQLSRNKDDMLVCENLLGPT